jgi:hypothetical protein
MACTDIEVTAGRWTDRSVEGYYRERGAHLQIASQSRYRRAGCTPLGSGRFFEDKQ